MAATSLYWFSPMRAPRTMASELRQHARAWANIVSRRRPFISNYGDELSALLVERLTGRPVRWSGIASAELVALGSVIDLYQISGGVGRIWGSGVANPDTPYDLARIGPNVLGVRGPLTRDRLELPGSTPLGDPALVAPHIFMRGKRQPNSCVLIPHYRAYLTRESRKAIDALRGEGYKVMPPNVSPEDMMDAIARAQFVASSGLHGIILSHAFGTPSTLISFADEVPPVPVFKYRDFFASVGIEPRLVSWRDVSTSSAAYASERRVADVRREAAVPGVEKLLRDLERSSTTL